MMKKLFSVLLLICMMLMISTALAADAEDISKKCGIEASKGETKVSCMVDGRYNPYWRCSPVKNPRVALTAPKGKTIASVYICFGVIPDKWDIETSTDGINWNTSLECDGTFLHTFVELPEPAAHVRIQAHSEDRISMQINELFVFTEGTVPDWVQRWEPSCGKTDILFVATHPDDELLFFGSAIPGYANREDCRVMVAYFTHSDAFRASELLNGLWYMGVRNYPDIAAFRDGKASSLSNAYKRIGGEEASDEWMMGLFRRYRPEVVVTQDIDGEYGHNQHRLASQTALRCVQSAADEWQVKKLYLHLWPEGQRTFDWSVPIKKMGGKTGAELAQEAYLNFHKSQPASLLRYGAQYDNRVFGLAFSTVGDDEAMNDFLEHIKPAQ